MTAFESLDEWFSAPQGERVAKLFSEEISRYHQHIKGHMLAQFGQCGSNLWLSQLNYNHKWIISPSLTAVHVDVRCALDKLPIARNTLDGVLAPLTLEVADDHLLDEIDRVLNPMGYVFFLGINPISLWGLWSKSKWNSNRHFMTHAGKTSSFSLKRAMIQRGYRQCALTNFYYVPPIQSEQWINRLSFLDEMGKMLSPFPAGFFCLVMQKYQFNLTGLYQTEFQVDLAADNKSTIPVTFEGK